MAKGNRIRAIGWDTDGVIVNTESLHLEAFNRTLLSEKFPAMSKKDYFDRYIGYDDIDFFRNYLKNIGKNSSDSLIKKLAEEKAEVYKTIQKSMPLEFYPGVIDSIKRIKELNVFLFNVTGSLRSELQYYLKNGGLENMFDVTITAEDTINKKPHPEPYIRALKALNMRYKNIDAEECTVIEDSRDGIISAKKASMKVIGITNTTSEEKLKEAGADLIVNSLSPEFFEEYLMSEKSKVNESKTL